MKKFALGLALAVAALAALTLAGVRKPPAASAVDVSPRALAAVATISERFLSYNVEMVELTGGRFWRPYTSAGAAGGDRFEYRPPLDLSHPRLRTLAAALGPAYVRFSGTWANATFFDERDERGGEAPAGFDTLLTRRQWEGAVAFARDVDAGIVLSFATSPGARDAQGVWQSDNADALLRYTAGLGARIAAAEFANEPNLISLTKAPEGYTPADYRRDFARFHRWLKAASPSTLVLAPGAVVIGGPFMPILRFLPGMETFDAEELMAPGVPPPDVVSFHYYGGASRRCDVPLLGTRQRHALCEAWLAGIDDGMRSAEALRARFAPAAPLWLSESAESACGGNPWARSFVDAFRFTDQLARTARRGLQVFLHNTLTASDYALLDERSHEPRPDYWAALLWRRFMGTRALDAGVGTTALHVYAHCLRGVPGGVALLAINLSHDEQRELRVDARGRLHALAQVPGDPARAALNGRPLALGPDDALPALEGAPFEPGVVSLAPESIGFLTFEDADNAACRP